MKLVVFLFLSFLTCAWSSPSPKEVSQQPSRNIRTRRQSEVEEHLEVVQLRHDENGQCMHVRAEEGVYRFLSPGGQQICGLYIFTEPDRVVEFEFNDFDISCTKNGLLSAIDGWELNGQFFPGDDDHPKSLGQRYSEFCGTKKPWKPFFTSQNVGLLEFRVPTAGEGFTVTVRFRDNPKPCNVVLQQLSGVYTLRNYGRWLNCSASIIAPESFQLLATSVGTQTSLQTGRAGGLDIETGIIRKCKKRGQDDFVEIRGGDGLDTSQMTVVDDFCGLDSVPSKRSVDVACGNTAVRLVSSGRFENSVTFSYETLRNLDSPAYICPSVLNAL